MTEDPQDPRVWWRLLVDAVAGLQRRDITGAQTYLRWTQAHRGKAAADQAKPALQRLARAERWGDCRQWPGWGYQTTPPSPPSGRTR